ncbi:hypothetical protein OG21DRAFT_748684 [Imleria badia]|nr:hypothetical protein OG21DRAFT_748684 [Imleria badia]
MIINGWTLLLFFGAAEFAAVLRVWVMYNRSRLILTALLGLFSLEIIATILTVAVHSDPRNDSAAAIQILNFSFCVVQPTSVVWTKVATVLQIMHGGVVCILAIFQFMRQSLQMYRITKQWQVNQYMSLFVRQGIIYFFAMFLFSLLDGLGISGDLPTVAWQAGLLFLLGYLPMYTLIPRFIISIRKLYARDVQGSPVGGIDTGFGLSSSGRDTVGTAMVFEDVEQQGVRGRRGEQGARGRRGEQGVGGHRREQGVRGRRGEQRVG